MGHVSQSKSLPLIVESIAYQRKEGVLLCTCQGKSIELFFQQGLLVHICGEHINQPTDEILHELLGWSNFEVQWQVLQVKVPQPNINEDTRMAFADVLQILTTNGNFESPEKSKLDEHFFDKANANEAELKTVNAIGPVQFNIYQPQSKSETMPALAHPPASVTPWAVESNLLLPPGERQNQLEDLLAQVSFQEQLEVLKRAHFTGYSYYKLQTGESSRGDFGLVLFANGQVSDLLCVKGAGKRQAGAPAYQAMLNLRLTPSIFKVEIRILKAYRAIATQDDKPYRVVKATKENFAGVMQAFQQSQRDGVVLFYLDKLKLNYFFLFEGGTQVGVFGPDTKSGHLQPLATPLAWPATDSKAFLTIMLAGKSAVVKLAQTQEMAAVPEIKVELHQEARVLPQPTVLEVPATETVHWENILPNLASQVEAQVRSTAAKMIYDDFNPFDF